MQIVFNEFELPSTYLLFKFEPLHRFKIKIKEGFESVIRTLTGGMQFKFM